MLGTEKNYALFFGKIKTRASPLVPTLQDMVKLTAVVNLFDPGVNYGDM